MKTHLLRFGEQEAVFLASVVLTSASWSLNKTLKLETQNRPESAPKLTFLGLRLNFFFPRKNLLLATFLLQQTEFFMMNFIIFFVQKKKSPK